MVVQQTNQLMHNFSGLNAKLSEKSGQVVVEHKKAEK